jgi:alginate O-acetyltransferase complex protein AlgJ
MNTKTRYPVYNKLDAHFNFLGGLVVYNEIMREISTDFDQLSPLTIDDYQISVQTKEGENGDLTYFSAIVGILPELEVSLLPIGKPHPQKKISKLLVFHDSFIVYLRPYLVHDFDQIAYVHHGDAYIQYAAIEKEKPDVVIYEIAERNLHALLAGSS